MATPQAPRDRPNLRVVSRKEVRPQNRTERAPPLLLWFAVLGAPLAFAADRVASVVLLSHGCTSGSGGVFGLTSTQAVTAGITIFTALIAIAAGLVAWSIWRRTGWRQDEVSVGSIPRVPFWALGGLFLSAIFLVAIVVTGGTAVALSTSCS
jgi:hypothetical protein